MWHPTRRPALSTFFYTRSVVNALGSINSDIKRARETLKSLAKRPLRLEKEERLASIRKRDEEHQETILYKYDWVRKPPLREPRPTYGEVATEYIEKEVRIPDPTSLLLVDEADRLRIASLEQVRAIFDEGQLG